MINGNYLGINEKIAMHVIAGEKNPPQSVTLQGAMTRIDTAYDTYLTSFANLEVKKKSDFARKSDSDIRAALKHCYSSMTTSMRIVRGNIFDRQPDQLKVYCPYCLLNEPSTLDHYIGQTEFPEFAILAKNLIPCCYDCNKIKDEYWRQRRKRRYIHFYIDQFLNHRFLKVKLVYPRGSHTPRIIFSLSKPTAMAAADYSIVFAHFRDLRLLEKYERRANEFISSQADALSQAVIAGVSKPSVVTGLNATATSYSTRYGVNYWLAGLHAAMALNRNFIASL